MKRVFLPSLLLAFASQLAVAGPITETSLSARLSRLSCKEIGQTFYHGLSDHNAESFLGKHYREANLDEVNHVLHAIASCQDALITKLNSKSLHDLRGSIEHAEIMKYLSDLGIAKTSIEQNKLDITKSDQEQREREQRLEQSVVLYSGRLSDITSELKNIDNSKISSNILVKLRNDYENILKLMGPEVQNYLRRDEEVFLAEYDKRMQIVIKAEADRRLQEEDDDKKRRQEQSAPEQKQQAPGQKAPNNDDISPTSENEGTLIQLYIFNTMSQGCAERFPEFGGLRSTVKDALSKKEAQIPADRVKLFRDRAEAKEGFTKRLMRNYSSSELYHQCSQLGNLVNGFLTFGPGKGLLDK